MIGLAQPAEPSSVVMAGAGGSTASAAGQVAEFNSSFFTHEATLEGHSDRVWGVCWAPCGNELASCSGDNTVRVWTRDELSDKWSCTGVLEHVHQRSVRSCAYSPCGKYLGSASFDATTAIWEKQDGEYECIATLEGHENEVKCVSWASSGGLLATCSRDKSVWIWAADGDRDFECAAVLTGHTQDVKFVVFHPHKELVVSCSYDDTMKVWVEDEEVWYCCDTLTGHSSTVWAAAFNSTGDRLVSSSADMQLRLWCVYDVYLARSTDAA